MFTYLLKRCYDFQSDQNVTTLKYSERPYKFVGNMWDTILLWHLCDY
jgi:hypothetical protein